MPKKPKGRKGAANASPERKNFEDALKRVLKVSKAELKQRETQYKQDRP